LPTRPIGSATSRLRSRAYHNLRFVHIGFDDPQACARRAPRHRRDQLIYEKRKKYKEALGFYEKSLVVEDRVRGPGHPLTKQTRTAVNLVR